jgi:hypothetical protein
MARVSRCKNPAPGIIHFAQRFGATELTYYADEAIEFFSPQAHGMALNMDCD